MSSSLVYFLSLTQNNVPDGAHFTHMWQTQHNTLQLVFHHGHTHTQLYNTSASRQHNYRKKYYLSRRGLQTWSLQMNWLLQLKGAYVSKIHLSFARLLWNRSNHFYQLRLFTSENKLNVQFVMFKGVRINSIQKGWDQSVSQSAL